MVRNHDIPVFPVAGADAGRQVVPLVERVVQPASIVDRLLDMPLPEGSGSAEWDAALMRRAEHRLVTAMQALLAGEPEKKRA